MELLATLIWKISKGAFSMTFKTPEALNVLQADSTSSNFSRTSSIVWSRSGIGR